MLWQLHYNTQTLHGVCPLRINRLHHLLPIPLQANWILDDAFLSKKYFQAKEFGLAPEVARPFLRINHLHWPM